MAEATTNEVKPSFDSSTYTKAKASISKYFPDEKTQALDALIKETTTTETARLKDIIAATNTSNGLKKGPSNTHTAGKTVNATAPAAPTVVQKSENIDEGKALAIVTQASLYMDRIIVNEKKFNREFTEPKRGGIGKRIFSNPFGEVQIPSQKGVEKNDLQMKNNQIFTAYEGILTDENLEAWRRNINAAQRNDIINELNTIWNKKAAKKLIPIQESKK